MTEEGFPALTLYASEQLGAGLESSRHRLDEIRDKMFDEFGLIVPPIRVQIDKNLPGNSFQLHVNGQRLATVSGDTDTVPQKVAEMLREQRAELLKPDLVSYYLARLSASQPALVTIVRRRFNLVSLTQTLRRRLQASVSIKDLSGTLEELLLESLVLP